MEYNTFIFSILNKEGIILLQYIGSRYCGEWRHISLIVNNPRNVMCFNLGAG
jgi:hypothetical protein